MRYLILDFETRSEADIKSVGAYEYAMHPTTSILCAAFRLGTRENLAARKTQIWRDTQGTAELDTLIHDPEIRIVAHNAFFERMITRRFFGDTPIERWECTAALAATHALPRDLEGACEALGLTHKKDPLGKKLINRHCKPQRITKNNPNIWNDDPEGLADLARYCGRDVDAETELFLRLPPLEETERKTWCLDQKINTKGIRVDLESVDVALKLADRESAHLENETQEMTYGMLSGVTKRDACLDYLKSEGVALPDIKAKTVQDALNLPDIPQDARRLLEIRQALSKTSTAKYTQFEQRTRTDGRLRDMLMYHGASTGRWTGRGLQPHNFPRGTIRDMNTAIEVLRESDLELIRLLYGNPMGFLSSCLRGMLIPDDGFEFYCGDFSAIEARVLFWLADHESGLQAFRDKIDGYVDMAADIYRTQSWEIDTGQREVGKRAFLGAGFQMSGKTFARTCNEQYGLGVSEELGVRAIRAYRTKHWPVPKLWSKYERAAIYAVEHKKRVTVNHTAWWVEKDFLYCQLPSGRRIAFYKPTIRYEMKWDEKRPALYHFSVNPKTFQWENAGTYGGKLVENVVQGIARDVMRDAMLRLDAANYEVVLTVHDEILNQSRKGDLAEYTGIMKAPPTWAPDLPVDVKAWRGPRYYKN